LQKKPNFYADAFNKFKMHKQMSVLTHIKAMHVWWQKATNSNHVLQKAACESTKYRSN